MQNWRDELQFPYPGYRDRIVQISQLADEGGLNLDMPAPNIDRLSDAGEYAAERLIARFYPPDAPAASEGWKNHREVRLRTFLGVLEEMARALQPKLADGRWNGVIDGISRNTYTLRHDELGRECLQRVVALGALLQRHAALAERQGAAAARVDAHRTAHLNARRRFSCQACGPEGGRAGAYLIKPLSDSRSLSFDDCGCGCCGGGADAAPAGPAGAGWPSLPPSSLFNTPFSRFSTAETATCDHWIL